MTDTRVDQQLRLLVGAIVDTTPPLPPLGEPALRRTGRGFTRPAAWGFIAAIILGGVAVLLIPRNTSGPSESTTSPGVAQGSTSNVGTETTVPGSSGRCSGQEPVVHEVPQMALPIGVAATRSALFAAATMCDFESLDSAVSAGSAPFDYGYQSAASPGAFWSSLEDHGIRVMALLTDSLNRPYTVQTSNDGDVYVWPEPYDCQVGCVPWQPVAQIAQNGEWLSFVIPQQLQIPDDLVPSTVAASSSWLSAGEPISDDEYHSLFGPDSPYDSQLVPGSAVRLAWTTKYDDRYDLGLFAAQRVMPELGEDPWYCLVGYWSDSHSGTQGSGTDQCIRTRQRFNEIFSFGTGGGSRCVPPLIKAWDIWGIPESVETVTFDLSDGSTLVSQATNGIAQVAWNRDVQVISATFDGITSDQSAQLDAWFHANNRSCTFDPGPPGT